MNKGDVYVISFELRLIGYFCSLVRFKKKKKKLKANELVIGSYRLTLHAIVHFCCSFLFDILSSQVCLCF